MTTPAQLAKELADLADALQQLGGCLDGNCCIVKPKGQHTNGGCKCVYAARDDADQRRKIEKVLRVYQIGLRNLPAIIEALREVDEINRVFDAQWEADRRATKRWQEAHPGNDNVWPDRANMVVWLMDQHVAALRRVEDEWQPIETAPRDGTLLLVWDGYQAFSGFWGRVAHPMNPQAWVGGHCKINHILQPTHWRPLPAPPALSEPAP